MNINSEDTIIACPGKQEGQILIKYNKEQTIINAHKSSTNAIQLNREGTILATASEKGTLIRIYKSKVTELSIK